MAQVFRLPRIGDSMAEITIQEWRVAVGDAIAADQIICDAETTKTVVEIPCPYSGTVLHLGGDVGDEIELDEILIVVGEPGEQWSGESAVAGADDEAGAAAASSTSAGKPAAPTGLAGGPVKALPKVRKLAKKMGVDLSAITPTGPNGTITEADLKSGGEAASKSAISVPHRREKMTTLRKAIAANLLKSANEVPHAAVFWDMDMTNIIAQRKALIAELGEKVSMDAVIMSRLLPLLEEFPEMNATVDGDDIVYYDEVNLGIAVGAKDGLVVPVIKNADQRDVKGLSDEVTRLASAVNDMKLKPEELSGMTCSISNVGGTGIAAGGMSINPLGICFMLSICKAVQTPVVIDGEIAIRPISRFQITFDHRVVDGAHVGGFFRRLEEGITKEA